MTGRVRRMKREAGYCRTRQLDHITQASRLGFYPSGVLGIHRPGDLSSNSGAPTPLFAISAEDRRKVPPTVQHADDFDIAVFNPEEDHMRTDDHRSQTG